MNPLDSLVEYELFVYTLQQNYSAVLRSTLVVIRRGATIAVLSGELELAGSFRLVVREQLSFTQSPGQIRSYGYEIWRKEELLYWYDSQPHPNNPDLASTHPHHKHIPPDIKHNRILAPGLTFSRPNLPFLIKEIEEMYLAIKISESHGK